jgi:heptosyltransferase-3
MLPYINLVSLIDCDVSNRRIKFFLSNDEKIWAKNFLSEIFIFPEKFIIGVKLKSLPSRSWRDWPIKNFLLLVEKILKIKPNAHFLLYGASFENEELQKLSLSIGKNYCNVLTNLSLRQVGAVMSQTQLYIGVDTGLTHLMSAFDIPMIALYHGLSPSNKAGPLGHPCFVALDHPLGKKCEEDDLLDVISDEKVFRKIKQFL